MSTNNTPLYTWHGLPNVYMIHISTLLDQPNVAALINHIRRLGCIYFTEQVAYRDFGPWVKYVVVLPDADLEEIAVAHDITVQQGYYSDMMRISSAMVSTTATCQLHQLQHDLDSYIVYGNLGHPAIDYFRESGSVIYESETAYVTRYTVRLAPEQLLWARLKYPITVIPRTGPGYA